MASWKQEVFMSLRDPQTSKVAISGLAANIVFRFTAFHCFYAAECGGMTAREGKGRSDWLARRDAVDLKPTNWEPARHLAGAWAGCAAGLLACGSDPELEAGRFLPTPAAAGDYECQDHRVGETSAAMARIQPSSPTSGGPPEPAWVATGPGLANPAAAEPRAGFVKLAMRNMVRKGRQSLFHFGLTALGLTGFLLLIAWLGRPHLPQ
jgi:hypothetical protein